MPKKGNRKGYNLTKEDMARGGRNGKRGASIKTQIQNILAGDVPAVVLEVLKNRKIVVDGKQVSAPVKPLDRHAARAVALVLLKNALADEAWAVRTLAEYIDGKPASNDVLTIKAQTPAEIAQSDEKAREVFDKYALFNRGQVVETTAKEISE